MHHADPLVLMDTQTTPFLRFPEITPKLLTNTPGPPPTHCSWTHSYHFHITLRLLQKYFIHSQSTNKYTRATRYTPHQLADSDCHTYHSGTTMRLLPFSSYSQTTTYIHCQSANQYTSRPTPHPLHCSALPGADGHTDYSRLPRLSIIRLLWDYSVTTPILIPRLLYQQALLTLVSSSNDPEWLLSFDSLSCSPPWT